MKDWLVHTKHLCQLSLFLWVTLDFVTISHSFQPIAFASLWRSFFSHSWNALFVATPHHSLLYLHLVSEVMIYTSSLPQASNFQAGKKNNEAKERNMTSVREGRKWVHPFDFPLMRDLLWGMWGATRAKKIKKPRLSCRGSRERRRQIINIFALQYNKLNIWEVFSM